MDAILTLGAVYAGVILFLLLSGREERGSRRRVEALRARLEHAYVGPEPPPRLICLGCDHPLEWCECLSATTAGLTDTEIARAMEGRAA